MKNTRQEKILAIIAEKEIETQTQLIDELNQFGFVSTQATVSRDMRELKLRKEISASGRYIYVAPTTTNAADFSDRLKTIFRECVTSFAYAQNLVVIKTLPGLANAACATIDAMEIKCLVGTIAGDDTAFLAMTDNAAAATFCDEIKSML